MEGLSAAMSTRRGVVKERENVNIAELECAHNAGMDSVKGATDCFPMHFRDEARVIDEWLVSQKCSPRGRRIILSALDVRSLRRLPLFGKSRPWPKDPVNRNFRYHWRAQVSRVLGWKERTPFPDHIDALIRKIWPNDVGAHECQGGRKSSCQSQACTSQPGHTTASTQEGASAGKESQGRLPKYGRHSSDVRCQRECPPPMQPGHRIPRCNTAAIGAPPKGGNGILPSIRRRDRWYIESFTDDSDGSTAGTNGRRNGGGAASSTENKEATMQKDGEGTRHVGDGSERKRTFTASSDSTKAYS